MKTLKELLNYLVQQHKKGADCKVLGQGSYSVVWDFGADAYKLTNELNYARALDMQQKSNELYKKGVNVPKIINIDKFETTTNSVVLNLKSFINYYDGEDYYKVISDFAKSFEINDGKYNFIGIRQQKIVGKNCFTELNRDSIQIADNISKRVKKLPDFLLNNLETQLNKNLSFFTAINPDHYTKFIKDGAAIINSGLTIDNQLQTNFLYSDSGFYYIDLDGLTDTRALSPVENIFDATIDNICYLVYTQANGYNKSIAQKQLDLCLTLAKSIKQSCSNPQIEQMFKQYNSKENMLKKLYNNAINNVDEQTAQKYKISMQQALNEQSTSPQLQD